jgi:Na+/H+-dicarboxylate symporter
MKRWVLNVLAVLIGGTAGLFLIPENFLYQLFEQVAILALSLVPFIVYIMLLPIISAGVASLNLQRLSRRILLNAAGWILLISAAAALTAGFLASLIPVIPFSEVTAAGTQSQMVVSQAEQVQAHITGLLEQRDITLLYRSFGLLLPLIIVAAVLGYGITPTREVLRPAYSVINSFSEAMYSLLPGLGHLLNVGLAFFSGLFLVRILNISGWGSITSFLIYLGVTVLVFILLVIPLAAALFAREKHPYRLISALISPMILSFFSTSSLFALPATIQHTRVNLGTAKRVSSTTIPLFALLGRSGSLLISIFTLISFHVSVIGGPPALTTILMIAVTAAALSLCSYAFPGFEVLMITAGSAAVLDLASLHEGHIMILLILYPIIQGSAAMIDTLSYGVGSCSCADRNHARVPVTPKERI